MAMAMTPRTRDIAAVTDVEAVKRQIINVLKMETYDAPFHPEVSVGLRRLPFKLFTDQNRSLAITLIKNAFEQWIRRATFVNADIKATPDQNALDITIVFRLKDIPEDITFRTVLERLR